MNDTRLERLMQESEEGVCILPRQPWSAEPDEIARSTASGDTYVSARIPPMFLFPSVVPFFFFFFFVCVSEFYICCVFLSGDIGRNTYTRFCEDFSWNWQNADIDGFANPYFLATRVSVLGKP